MNEQKQNKEKQFHFRGNILIYGKIKLITGTHIGGAKEGIEIGGVDSPVIKLPVCFEKYENPFESVSYELPEGCPYIPGSTLKGKMRMLLEWNEDKVKIVEVKDKQSNEVKGYRADVHKCKNAECPVCTIFGTSPEGELTSIGPTRLKVFDAYPTKQTLDNIKAPTDETYTEIKTENTIDRLTSSANPRSFERIPAGAEFVFEMKYTILKDKDVEFLKNLFKAMKLLQDDAIGGSTSRGYGRIKISSIKAKLRTKKYYEGLADEIPIEVNDKIEEIKFKENDRDSEWLSKLKKALEIDGQ